MREKRRYLIEVLAVLSVATLIVLEVVLDADASTVHDQAGNIKRIEAIASPFDADLKYPFTKRDSLKSKHWRSKSQDYPYFGAPRDGNCRRHAGIDVYPVTGAGTPIRAIQGGTVIAISPFYKRHNGEITYAILVDHKKYVANYAELIMPILVPGAAVKKKQIIGFLSGTEQLHFGLYKAGTTSWISWHGKMPANLIDPTYIMRRAFKK